MTDTRRLAITTAVAIALMHPIVAGARDLRAVPAPDHDPLFVDRSTIRWSGNSVSFLYVLNVQIALDGSSAPRRWKSNEIETTIDCVARTYSIGSVRAHSGPAATGSRTGGYSPTREERRAEPIVRGSTWHHLAAYLCSQRRIASEADRYMRHPGPKPALETTAASGLRPLAVPSSLRSPAAAEGERRASAMRTSYLFAKDEERDKRRHK